MINQTELLNLLLNGKTATLEFDLMEKVGYDGPADLLALWWEPGGDELTWFDGYRTLCGAEYRLFLQWARNEGLFNLEIGDSDNPPKNCLVFDRRNKTLSYFEMSAGRAVISSQWSNRDYPRKELPPWIQLDAMENFVVENFVVQPPAELPRRSFRLDSAGEAIEALALARTMRLRASYHPNGGSTAKQEVPVEHRLEVVGTDSELRRFEERLPAMLREKHMEKIKGRPE